MLTKIRRALPLLASVALILGLGGVAAWGHLATAGHVLQTQRTDRLRLEQTLGGLTAQYLQFNFLDTQRDADAVTWNLRPNDAADRAALQRTVLGSHLNTYGAMLTTPLGQPLTSYATGALPSPLDPGLGPLRLALLAGRPGLSNVLHAGTTPVVAFAVPVRRAGAVVGLLVSFADLRTWPLQVYNSTLNVGPSARPYVVDAGGTVTASGTVAAVGKPLDAVPTSLSQARSAVLTTTRHGVDSVVSYSPAGFGWTAVTIQPQAAFSSGLQARSQRDALALVALLTLVVLVLLWLNHSRQRALRRLADERLQDPLTGLAQRRLFHLKLESALARQLRTGAPLTVVYCDLNDFKAVNDTYGHNVGDQLLVAVARRMDATTRADDFVARLGGDEFALVLEGTDAQEAAEVVARLRAAVEQPLALNGNALQPRIAIGAAVLRDPDRADDLLAEADLAMYRVKHGGTDSPVVVLSALPASREDAPQVVPPRSPLDLTADQPEHRPL